MKEYHLQMDCYLVRLREQDRRNFGFIITLRPRSIRYRVVDTWNSLRQWIFGVGV